ncbi:replication protein A 70 kDa DNA-binding subunit E-like [Tasmannia lanceolata]
MVQPGIASGNPQSYGGSLAGGSFTGGVPPGRNATNGVSMYPKAEPGGPQPPINNSGRSAQTAYHQPVPMYANRGPIAKNEAPARIIPIAALNPYQGRWTIKARVTAKGELRRYNNPRGEGKVFSFDLLDSDGGEIRVTCFNMVADQFYDMIEVGKVYLISKGSLKQAQKNFNHLNNDWEIFLESTSTIQPCLEEDNSIPRQQFHFRSISDVEDMESNSMVDVIGIVSSINPSSTIMRKNGTETLKRTLQLKDMSGQSVELTLWGNFCNAEGQQLQVMCDSGVFPVVAVKAARVNDFNGKTVGTISTSQLFINPDFPEAKMLREWFDREGKNAVSHSISMDTPSMGKTEIRKTVSQIKDEGLGRSAKPDWITVKATVSFIKTENFCYTACPLMVGDRQCNKKVNNNGDGTWICERCDQSFPECDYRYLLQFQIQDHTGFTAVTAFQESGEEIMGISAKDLYLLKYEEQDDGKFEEIIRGVLFTQYLFKLKVKEETFNDEQQVKLTVVKAEKVNFLSESKYLLSLIDNIPEEEPSFVGQRRGSTGVYLLCNGCGGSGHNSQNCPRVISGQGQPMGGGYGNRIPHAGANTDSASGKCFKCNQSGHWARDCPRSNSVSTAYGNSSVTGRYGIAKMGGGF